MSSIDNDYEPWFEKLQAIADQREVDLRLDHFHYHTYFMRGWTPDSVIQDVIESEDI